LIEIWGQNIMQKHWRGNLLENISSEDKEGSWSDFFAIICETANWTELAEDHMQRLKFILALLNKRIGPEASSIFVQKIATWHCSHFLHFVPEDHCLLHYLTTCISFVSSSLFLLSDNNRIAIKGAEPWITRATKYWWWWWLQVKVKVKVNLSLLWRRIGDWRYTSTHFLLRH
jgi:hypothetical protein